VSFGSGNQKGKVCAEGNRKSAERGKIAHFRGQGPGGFGCPIKQRNARSGCRQSNARKANW